ncbi:MAG: DUF4258 domain-containing protein [Comamonadaceae bacterium PBBC1]|nr:MAG: DUF4258 domain-containing protein [Comamonadaceae bacterium PBBC1]
MFAPSDRPFDVAKTYFIHTGETRFKDPTHLWAYKNLPGRTDNLVCAVLVLEDAVVVKTVMHEFVLED